MHLTHLTKAMPSPSHLVLALHPFHFLLPLEMPTRNFALNPRLAKLPFSSKYDAMWDHANKNSRC